MADNLTMKVVLDMLDKITKPLKAIKAQSGSTARALKDTRDRLRELDAQQKKIGEFTEIRNGLKSTVPELRNAQQNMRGIGAQLEALKNQTSPATSEIKKLTAEFNKANRTVAGLKNKYHDYQKKNRELRTSLHEVGISTRNLGAAQTWLKDSIAYTNAELSSQQKKLAAVTAQQERMTAARHRLDRSRQFARSVTGAGAGMIGASMATGLPIIRTVRDFMTYEDSMLGVAKQVNGARDANGKLTALYYDMGEEIKRLATQIPMATAEIANLVTSGARMGITGDKHGEEAKQILLKFARDTAMMATAFEMPAEEIGDQMGKIAGIFKIDISNGLSKLGDSINYLDDNAISKGADIISVLQGDLAGAASTIGLRASNAAALASTLLTLGESPERADTAASGMLRQLQIAKMNPKRFQIGAQMIGMSGRDLQMGMIRDAQGTILKVLDRINALPTESKMEAVTRLFGKDWGGAIAKLAGGVEEYRRQLELANGAVARGSMSREFQARLGALSAQWQILKNRLFDATSTIGETLAPALRDLFDSIGRVATRFAEWTKDNPVLAGTLVKIAAIIAVLLVGFGALALLVGSLLLPFALLRFSWTALSIQGGVFTLVLSGIRFAVLSLGKALLWLGRALLLTPLGLFLTALAGAGFLVYKNWDAVKEKLGISNGAFAFADLGDYNGAMQKLGVPNDVAELDSYNSAMREMQEMEKSLDRSADGSLGMVQGLSRRLAQAGAGIAIGAAAMPALSFDMRPPITATAAQPVMFDSHDQIEIVVQAAPGMDERAIAAAVRAELDRRDREKQARLRSSLTDYDN